MGAPATAIEVAELVSADLGRFRRSRVRTTWRRFCSPREPRAPRRVSGTDTGNSLRSAMPCGLPIRSPPMIGSSAAFAPFSLYGPALGITSALLAENPSRRGGQCSKNGADGPPPDGPSSIWRLTPDPEAACLRDPRASRLSVVVRDVSRRSGGRLHRARLGRGASRASTASTSQSRD